MQNIFIIEKNEFHRKNAINQKMLYFPSPDCFVLFYIDVFVLKEFMRTNMVWSRNKIYKITQQIIVCDWYIN